MTTLTIGRFSMSDGPTAIRHDGDNLDLDIQIDAATTTDVTEAKVLRQQLLGLANNADEPVVPLTFSDDSDLDGYYVVEGVSCEALEMFLNNGTMIGSVSLRRVTGGYAKPIIEVSFVMADVTNPHGFTERGRIGVPNDGQEIQSFPLISAPDYIETETGDVALVEADGFTTPLPRSGVVRYWTDPANYYAGAATLEVLIGATWYPVVGKQVPANFTRWRLNNGWFRFGPTATSSPFYMLAEGWNGSAWITVGTFERGEQDGGWTRHDFGASNPTFATIPGTSVLVTPQVLRNGPETVTIRIPQVFGQETWSISRGDAFVRGYYNDQTVTTNFGVATSTTIAVTDDTYGMVRTTASSGFKFFVMETVANTVDTTNGRVYTTGLASSVNFAIGFSTPTTFGAIAEHGYALAMSAQSQKVSTR